MHYVNDIIFVLKYLKCKACAERKEISLVSISHRFPKCFHCTIEGLPENEFNEFSEFDKSLNHELGPI